MPPVELSANMEDYLEAILQLEMAHKVARVRDIARHLQVRMPSVSGALKNLKARGLVNHEAYGYVTLTPRGREVARHVRDRHHAIVDFLTTVLQLPPAEAEPEACGLEHALGPEALHRLLSLTRFLHEHPGLYQEWQEHLQEAETEAEAALSVMPTLEPTVGPPTLDHLPPGAMARITHLGGVGAVRRRLLDMGLRPGTELRVVRVAPLGDPIEIHLMEYHLSLRRSEASGIEVEVLALPLGSAAEGTTVELLEPTGEGLRGQLEAEGLRAGQTLTVRQALGATGGMLVEAEGKRVHLGRGQAQRLLVHPLPPGAAD